MTDRSALSARRARPWWLVVSGVAWLASGTWLWLTRADVLLAGHPAYAVVVTLAVALGLLLLAGAWRASNRPRTQRRRVWRVLGRVAGGVATVAVVGSLVWLRPFGASETALGAMDGSTDVRIDSTLTRITLTPTAAAPERGLVFQPGARVDPRAYVPLLSRVSAAGYLVVVVKQPFNIGFAATGAPGAVMDDHPDITSWVVGGHSLGGVAASSYAGTHPDDVDGLVLWASYPLDSLADRTDLCVSSVSGTRDGLATPGDIEDSRSDLPSTATFVAVEGAVHAFFGDYGEQPGDGEPTISRADAQQQIADASIDLLAGRTGCASP